MLKPPESHTSTTVEQHDACHGSKPMALPALPAPSTATLICFSPPTTPFWLAAFIGDHKPQYIDDLGLGVGHKELELSGGV